MRNRIMIAALTVCMLFTIMLPSPLSSAGVDASSDKIYYDWDEIDRLPSDSSYGTLFKTANTEFIPIMDGIDESLYELYTEHSGDKISYVAVAFCQGGSCKIKITSCAIDADGDLCDVVVTVDNVQPFVTPAYKDDTPTWVRNGKSIFSGRAETWWDADGNSCTGDPWDPTMYRSMMCVSYWNNLVRFNFNTNMASTDFAMTYYKAGTYGTKSETLGNVSNVVSLVYDLDVKGSVGNVDCSYEIIGGNEGVVADAKIVYDISDDGILMPCSYNNGSKVINGICTNPDVSHNTDGVDRISSVMLYKAVKNATYNFKYVGRTCGIGYMFASPYLFELDKPTISVDKTLVYEDEQFNYTISQFVPNSYYAQSFHFIDNVDIYSDFQISDTINSNLTIGSGVKIVNEDNKDVTSMFTVTVKNNVVTAVLKSNYYTNVNFYNHIYKVIVPVSAKTGTGLKTGSVVNNASSSVDISGNVYMQTTGNVTTGLKYDVNVTASIDNGSVQIDSGKKALTVDTTEVVNHNKASTARSVKFTVPSGYRIKTVSVDGVDHSVNDLTYSNGVYTYSLGSETVKQNIEHSVAVTTEKISAKVIVKYVDTSGKEIANSETIDGSVGDSYSTSAKTVSGYKLKTTPSNKTGTMVESGITVTYVYDKLGYVVVKYVDEDGNELADSESLTGVVGNKYTSAEKVIDLYRLKCIPDNKDGTIIDGTTEVVYVYEYIMIRLPDAGCYDMLIYGIVILTFIGVFVTILQTKKKSRV